MRFNNLQVGRIAAATGVLVFHAAFYGQYALGVANPLTGSATAYWFRTAVVFLFALSGFVLAHSLQRGSLRSFVGFRLLRLFLPFWAALVLVLAARWATDTAHPVTAKGLFRLFVLWPDGKRQLNVLHVEWTLVYELFLSMAIVPLAALGRGRGLCVGCGAWLALCLGRQLAAPVAEPVWQPRWGELLLSVVNVPFLMGVLMYFVRRRVAGRREVVFGAAALALTGGAVLVEAANTWSYVLQSVAAALAVGFWATGRQADGDSQYVRAGDWAYGVYLLHVPVMLTFLTLAARYPLVRPSGSLVLFAAVLALVVGAGFGEVEWRCYRWVRAMLVDTRPPGPGVVILTPTDSAA